MFEEVKKAIGANWFRAFVVAFGLLWVVHTFSGTVLEFLNAQNVGPQAENAAVREKAIAEKAHAEACSAKMKVLTESMTVNPFNTGQHAGQSPEWNRLDQQYQQDCVGRSTDPSGAKGNDDMDICTYSKDADLKIKACSEALRGAELTSFNRAAVYNNRATGYWYKKDAQHIFEDVERAIAMEATLAEPYNTRGLAHVLNKDPTRAIEDFTTAIKLDPMVSTYYHNRGSAYAKLLHDQAKARADFDQAERLETEGK